MALKPIDFRKIFRFKFVVRLRVTEVQQLESLRVIVLYLQDEPALDAGGVAREWFECLTRVVFDPNFGLFKYSAVDNLSYQVCNPSPPSFP